MSADSLSSQTSGEPIEHELQNLLAFFSVANHERAQREDELLHQYRKAEEAASTHLSKALAELDQVCAQTELEIRKTKAEIDKGLSAYADLSQKMAPLKDPARQLGLHEDPLLSIATFIQAALTHFAKSQGDSRETTQLIGIVIQRASEAETALAHYQRVRSQALKQIEKARQLLNDLRSHPSSRFIRDEILRLEELMQDIESDGKLDTTRTYDRANKNCEVMIETAVRKASEAGEALAHYQRVRSTAVAQTAKASQLLNDLQSHPLSRFTHDGITILKKMMHEMESNGKLDTTEAYERVSVIYQNLTQFAKDILERAGKREHIAVKPTIQRLVGFTVLCASVAFIFRFALALVGYRSWIAAGWSGNGFVSWKENWSWSYWFKWPGLDWQILQPETGSAKLAGAFVVLLVITTIYNLRKKL